MAYNNAFRILHNLDKKCSAKEMFVFNRTKSFPEMYRKVAYGFMTRIKASDNLIMRSIVLSDIFYTSTLTLKWHNAIYGGYQKTHIVINL